MEAEGIVTGMVMLSVTVVLGGSLVGCIYLYNRLMLKPNRLRLKLQRQGIRGPSPSFLLGNIPEMKRIQLQAHSTVKTPPKQHDHDHGGGSGSGSGGGTTIAHDWPRTLFPYFERWRNEYGPIFMYSTGIIQRLYTTDPEMVKEMSICMSLGLGKPSYLSKDQGPLLGQGILSSNGPSWAHQRKIIAPEFYLDKVKGMLNIMVDSTTSMLASWEHRIDSEGGTADMRVDGDLRSLSADIISKACFGSSYSKGKDIFLKLRTLQGIMSKKSIFVGVPGLRYVPTKNNRDIWMLEKEIHSMILKVVKQRIEEATHEKDLLQMILEGAKNYGDDDLSGDEFIVDNCKNIYFAGHETTAITASWSLVLLAAHPDWQARARAEVLEICGNNNLPDADMIMRMKTLTMIIQETLRLYPPAIFASREALQDMKLKDFLLPKGLNISVMIPTMHRNPDLWGADVNQFNPERFSNGILKACKVPQAYLPFGMGARTCLGQHLAMVELKAILSLILSKFCFELSPTYQHSPSFRLVVEPEHGVNLLVKKRV